MKKRIVFLSMIVLFGFAIQASAETTSKTNPSKTEMKPVKQTVAKSCCTHHAPKKACGKPTVKANAKGCGGKCATK